MNYTVKYTIYLIGCAAGNKSPELPSERLDYELMFKLSKEYQCENLVYVSLQMLNLELPQELLRRFCQCYQKAVVREARQELELQNICAAFSEAELRHIPLKGSVSKYMYPSPDLRQNGDIDILVDTADENKIREIMIGMGYENNTSSEKDMSFYRGKMHIEVHRHLFHLSNPRREFFDRVWETAVQTDGFTYEMMPELFYTYLLAHLAGHLRQGGAGIKLVTDFYVFNKPTDQIILNGFLRQTGLDTLHGIVLRLIDYWFNMKQDADEPVKFLSDYILKNGVYGSQITGVHMEFSDKLSGTDRILHYFKMTFRPYGTMKYLYPVLQKAPVLLPLCYCHRILKKLTWGRARTKAVWQGSHSVEEIKILSEFKKIL